MRKPPPLGTPNDPKTMVFQIGPLRLTGAAALVATIVLFGAMTAALVYYRARILSSPPEPQMKSFRDVPTRRSLPAVPRTVQRVRASPLAGA